MRSVSISEIAQLRKDGVDVKVIKTQKPKPVISSTDKALSELSKYIKQLVTKKDSSTAVAKSVAQVAQALASAATTIKAMQPEKKIKSWDVQVYRGQNMLIKSLKLKAN